MDPSKLKLSLAVVIAAISIAAGAGGTAAIFRSNQAETAERVDAHTRRLEALEHESQANRERVLRIEMLSDQTNKVVERIEEKLDRVRR